MADRKREPIRSSAGVKREYHVDDDIEDDQDGSFDDCDAQQTAAASHRQPEMGDQGSGNGQRIISETLDAPGKTVGIVNEGSTPEPSSRAFSAMTQPQCHMDPPSGRHDDDESNRVPYFRYFGPTAIVPGFKQMVVNLPYPRRNRGDSFSTSSPTETRSQASLGTLHQDDPLLENHEDPPVYDPNDPGPTHPIIIRMIDTFFTHLGCNYPFLRREKFLKMVGEKRVEPILLDAILALAARFHKSKDDRESIGHFYAQRARMATVDPFPCPTVGAVQAYLLLAYESFGQDQDSALWAYLQLAIGMSIDIGLPRKDGVKYQGDKDPWYTLACIPKYVDQVNDKADSQGNTLGPEEQAEVEQERINTFWAVFVLDRVISSGTGRPVRFKDEDFEIPLPEPSLIPENGRPAPFPDFIRIVHLYGRVSDVLNNVRNPEELSKEGIQEKLSSLVQELTLLHQRLDARLHFNAVNFQEYSRAGQGTTFILLHLWFHTLIIILHEPTVIFGAVGQIDQLLPHGREVAISSARSIADILSFAELIDPRSVIGNPFTSQPMYIAACAFLMQSGAAQAPTPLRSDAAAPNDVGNGSTSAANEQKAKQPSSLLAFGANQNYQRCYKSLQQLQSYWGGVRYILTALDQKSKGIWDCETYTLEEYALTKKLPGRRSSSVGRLPREFEIPSTPNVPPMVGFSLTGTTNSPNSSLTWVYQNQAATDVGPAQGPHQARLRAATLAHQQQTSTGMTMRTDPGPSHDSVGQASAALTASESPGGMLYDPIRHEPPSQTMYTSAYPQAPVSAMRFSPLPATNTPPPKPRQRRDKRPMSSMSSPNAASATPNMTQHFQIPNVDPAGPHQLRLSSEGTDQLPETGKITAQTTYIPPAPASTSGYEPSQMMPSGGSAPKASAGAGDQHTHLEQSRPGEYSSPMVQSSGGVTPGSGNSSQQLADLSFDSREITWGQDPTEAMAPWLVEFFSTNDIIGLFQSTAPPGTGDENGAG